jgi:hypothetical protein
VKVAIYMTVEGLQNEPELVLSHEYSELACFVHLERAPK